MQIDASKQIEVFKDFIEKNYKSKIHDLIREGKKSLLVDFLELSSFDIELSEQILEEPEETTKAAEYALGQFDIGETQLKRVRFFNLPKSQVVTIKDIRSMHLNKFMALEGIVRQASDVRPHVTLAKFECPSCGNTMTIAQLESTFREPTRCSCGRKGKFRLLSKELVDIQRLLVEEVPESLEGGEQPKRIHIFLKEDLVEPKMEKKTTPGSKIRVFGVVKEVPIPSKSGGTSTTYDLMIDANFIEPIEEAYEEIEIGQEEIKEIKKLAADPRIYERLLNSIAPSIYGHNDIKEALALQLFGGVKKIKEDGTKTRGDCHILLVGDPGCISGDSQVALYTKGMDKIQNLGQYHKQPIREAVVKIRKSKSDKVYDFATLFQHYKQQPVLKVVTETRKELICTYNQPLLTKKGWVRADELNLGTKIRVMPKIPNYIKKLAVTNFTRIKKTYGELKEVSLPEVFTLELAALCGYIIGEQNLHSNGYRVTCYVNNQETDLIPILTYLWKNTFNVIPKIFTNNPSDYIKTIEDENGLLRQFVSSQEIHYIEVNSRQVAQCLMFLSNKRVPQEIFKSPKEVISKFISWLFEADGCAFGNGRGETSIQLKSRSINLLKDVQLLLLYFGIQGRIIEDNLSVRRSRNIELFAKHIGFNSHKKKKALEKVLESIKQRKESNKRKSPQRYEKIADIIPFGFRDVYDFEVPLSHCFIANGIVCHNSGKSATLQFISKAAPKGRFVSGRGASGAGITASVVKDDFIRGWALEAGAMVLANKGICVIDELDKMSPEDRSALHEAMEQQSITISKANIQATLRAETTILAAANPKLGRFDPYQPIAAQIDLPPTLINRFDLIFPVKDIPNKELDEKIAKHVLSTHQKPKSVEPEIPIRLLKKYIAYVRQNVFPALTDGAIEEIISFYVGLRNTSTTMGESEVKPIPITARQLEALIRLSEASARIRLSDKVLRKDSKRAIDLLKHCLMQVGIDRETGQIDIDRISTGIPATTRSKIITIREIINELEGRFGKTIPLEQVVAEATKKGIEEDKVEEIVENLKRSGDLFEPKRGFIQKI